MEEPAESPYLTGEAVGAWLKSALTAKSEKFRSPGVGDDARFESASLVGSSLLVKEDPFTRSFSIQRHTEMKLELTYLLFFQRLSGIFCRG